MHGSLLIAHVLAGSIWVGGHLVLALSLLPEALGRRAPQMILDYERVYERIGLPALLVQVATGLALAVLLRSDIAGWFDLADPTARAILGKLALLAGTIGLALHARLALVPRLTPSTLPFLGAHILAVTTLAVLFAALGVSFRWGGV